MDDLPLSRNDDGEIHLAGTSGPVSLQIVYDCILGTGGQGVVFVGNILGKSDSRVIMKVSEIASGHNRRYSNKALSTNTTTRDYFSTVLQQYCCTIRAIKVSRLVPLFLGDRR